MDQLNVTDFIKELLKKLPHIELAMFSTDNHIIKPYTPAGFCALSLVKKEYILDDNKFSNEDRENLCIFDYFTIMDYSMIKPIVLILNTRGEERKWETLDQILETLAPNISLLQYKVLLQETKFNIYPSTDSRLELDDVSVSLVCEKYMTMKSLYYFLWENF